VSGLLQPFGPSGQIVRLVASGDLLLYYNPRILAEYQEVLLRKKFGFDPERVDALLEEIRASGIPVAARPLLVRLPILTTNLFWRLLCQVEHGASSRAIPSTIPTKPGVELRCLLHGLSLSSIELSQATEASRK